MAIDTWATDGNRWCSRGHGLQGQDEACVACEDGVPSIPRIHELEAEVERLREADRDADRLKDERDEQDRRYGVVAQRLARVTEERDLYRDQMEREAEYANVASAFPRTGSVEIALWSTRKHALAGRKRLEGDDE